MKDRREFLDFAASVLGILPESATMDTAYGSIPEWDSVMHLRLVMELENRYGFETPLAEIATTRTLGEFFARIPL